MAVSDYPTPEQVADVLGPLQRRVILSLSHEEFGKACDHQAAKRMWYGVRGRGGLRLNRYIYLVEHLHCGGNNWRLNGLGQSVKEAIAAGSRRAKTPQAVECEASQSGGVAASPKG